MSKAKKKKTQAEQVTIKVRSSTHKKALLAQAHLIGKHKKRISLTQVYEELIDIAVKAMKIDGK